MTHVAAYLVHWRAPEWCRESVLSVLASSGVSVSCTVINNEGELDLPAGVKIVETGSNLGFAGGANVALRLALDATADYIFVGCHDIRLGELALWKMALVLDNDPGLGIVGPALDGDGGSEPDLEWISGAGMLMRREVVVAVRFNEKFGSYVEDVDFCYHARRLGWRVGRCEEANATTKGSVDEGRKLILMNANTIAWHLHEHDWRLAAIRSCRISANLIGALRCRDYRRALEYLTILPLSLYRWVQMMRPL